MLTSFARTWSRGRLAVAAILLASPAPALAAQPAPDAVQPGGPIVVTGERADPAALREQARRFVQGTGAARGQIPAARWADPVCPRVIGIHESYGRIVEARIRTIAREARIALGADGCRPNLTVTFAHDAKDLVRRIAQRRPRALADVPVDRRGALVDGAAPIRWWYTTDLRSYDSTSASSSQPPSVGGNAEGGGPMLPGVPTFQHYNSSAISTQAVRVIRSATVLVDLAGAEGSSLEAVADYAGFVGLAEIRTSDPIPRPSILGLFGVERDRRALSDWDLAFLRTLYRLPLDRIARHHRGLLRRGLLLPEAGDESLPWRVTDQAERLR